MAVTLRRLRVVQVAVPLWVRPHLAAPVQEIVPIDQDHIDGIEADATGHPIRLAAHTRDHDDWVLTNETVDAAGARAALPAWFADCGGPPPGPPPVENGPVEVKDIDACFTRLTAEGYRQHLAYQPASRFWALQWRETGLLVAVSALLALGCGWWVRRRLT